MAQPGELFLMARVPEAIREALLRVRQGSLASGGTRALAVLSILAWTAAIAAGRLLAYTCTRLTVGSLCE